MSDTFDAALRNAQNKLKILPTYERKWWYSDELVDIRPAIWSITNNPDEWSVTSDMRVKHLPSDIEFRTMDVGPFSIVDIFGPRGMTISKPQMFQGFAMSWAVEKFRKRQKKADVVNQTFAAHFRTKRAP